MKHLSNLSEALRTEWAETSLRLSAIQCGAERAAHAEYSALYRRMIEIEREAQGR